jgi:hypothetical protein
MSVGASYGPQNLRLESHCLPVYAKVFTNPLCRFIYHHPWISRKCRIIIGFANHGAFSLLTGVGIRNALKRRYENLGNSIFGAI